MEKVSQNQAPSGSCEFLVTDKIQKRWDLQGLGGNVEGTSIRERVLDYHSFMFFHLKHNCLFIKSHILHGTCT